MFRIFSYCLFLLVLVGYSSSIIQPYFEAIEVIEQCMEKDSTENDDETENEIDRKITPIEISVFGDDELIFNFQSIQSYTHFFDYFFRNSNHIPNVPFPPPDFL